MKKLLGNMRDKYRLRDYKVSLVLFVLLLSGIGVLMVRSARESLTGRQLMGVILGFFAMLVISLIDYHWVLKLYWLMYVANLVLLGAVLLFGKTTSGATRWLDLGIFQFQPSDLTKILMILFFARFLAKKEENINKLSTILEAIGLIIPSLIMVLKQPDLSTTLCIAATFCVLLYIAGLSYKIIGTVLAVAIPMMIVFLVIAVQPDQKLLKDYQQDRILAWLNPDEYSSTDSYQQLNSVTAIGSGQLTGKGYDNDDTTSVKNGNFVSEPQTDFIFAIIGEELGFVGCCSVIFLLLLIVVNCIIIGTRAGDMEGRIICGGVAALIGIQSFINISVTTMLFPNTGISLPFVSYGLTSVVCFFMGIGFVLNVGLQPDRLGARE